VRLGLDGTGRSLIPHRRDEIVAQRLLAGDVLHLPTRRYDTLSGGEQRRVQFPRELAQLDAGRSISARQALLLDEPVANLDFRHQLTLFDAARAIALARNEGLPEASAMTPKGASRRGDRDKWLVRSALILWQ
jgi:iron complex transport system ATP-binding protein